MIATVKDFQTAEPDLDHIALGCEDEAELERVANALNEAGVENTGLKMDEALDKRYVAFKDTDRIAWEFLHELISPACLQAASFKAVFYSPLGPKPWIG